MSQDRDKDQGPEAGEAGRLEVEALRAEVARLAAELAGLRAHAARLEALAVEDPLTGLLNRRGFLTELSRAIAYRARYGTEIALLMADLDDLKPINDRHGHAMGDQALIHVGSVLRGNLRSSDAVGRIGGDEFAIVLWQAGEASARQKAALLQQSVAGSPLARDGTVLELSASVGVTVLLPDDTPEAALTRADRAMYAHKGRQKPA